MRSRLAQSLSLALAACLPLATGCSELPGDDDPDGGPGPGPSGVCTTARLIAGNPISTVAENPTAWTPSGFPALGEPPLRVFNLAARGRTVLVNTQQAMWKLDLAAANPTFVRVFGDDVGGIGSFQPSGTCAEGRTMLAHGLAWLPDGRLNHRRRLRQRRPRAVGSAVAVVHGAGDRRHRGPRSRAPT
jgi:hypothetical protein